MSDRERTSALVGFDRGYVASNTAAAPPAAAPPVFGRAGGPLMTAAPPPSPMLANRGVAMADAILARQPLRAIDLEDPEPYDPSLENQLPDDEDDDETRQNGDEDDDDMPRDEDGQFARQDDDENEPMADEPAGRDVTIIAVDEDVEEEIPDETP